MDRETLSDYGMILIAIVIGAILVGGVIALLKDSGILSHFAELFTENVYGN